jgi:hypothetical protein
MTAIGSPSVGGIEGFVPLGKSRGITAAVGGGFHAV